MQPRRENALTAILAGACLVGGAVVVVPRAVANTAPLIVEQPPLKVAVLGEVTRPGVYELPFGTRVEDAVAAAGGMLTSAAPDLVAPAAALTDGQTVLVPSSTVAVPGVAGGAERVSLNSASLAELDALPGVGPVIAERIVAHRPYTTVDDLLAVPGIGEATLARLAPLVGM